MADYQGKKVVIIGLGMTGLSCVDFFMARGVTPRVMDTRVAPPGLDKLPESVECHVGGLNDTWLLAADLIVASPGIALAHPSLSAAADAGVEIVAISNCSAAKRRRRLSPLPVLTAKALLLPWWARWRKPLELTSAWAAISACRR